MSVALTFNPSSFTGTRLAGRIVWVLLWCSLTLGFSRVASAGCNYGHAQESQFSSPRAERGYARKLPTLGQWVYEAGQIKYVAPQPDGKCHGPNCSADSERHEDAGMSLPQRNRTHLNVAHFHADPHRILPGLVDAMPLEDAKASLGHPPAYEYPP
jgi:hypothetical protein